MKTKTYFTLSIAFAIFSVVALFTLLTTYHFNYEYFSTSFYQLTAFTSFVSLVVSGNFFVLAIKSESVNL